MHKLFAVERKLHCTTTPQARILSGVQLFTYQLGNHSRRVQMPLLVWLVAERLLPHEFASLQ